MFKKSIIISLLIFVIISVSAVSAAENITDTNLEVQKTNDESTEIVLEENTDKDELISSSHNEDNLNTQQNESVLSDGIDPYFSISNEVHDYVYSKVLDVKINSQAKGNILIDIDGENVYNKSVYSGGNYIYSDSLSKFPTYGMHNLTVFYSGTYYNNYSITKEVNFTYNLGYISYSNFNTTNRLIEFYFAAPSNFTEYDIYLNNRYYSNLSFIKKPDFYPNYSYYYFNISIDDFNLGKNKFTLHHKGALSKSRNQDFELFPQSTISSILLIDDDELNLNLYFPVNETGIVSIVQNGLNEIIASNQIINGIASFKIPNLNCGDFDFQIYYNGENLMYGGRIKMGLSNPDFEVIATTNITKGEDVQIRILKDNLDTLKLDLFIDGVSIITFLPPLQFDNEYGNYENKMDISIPNLSAGTHEIVIRTYANAYYYIPMESLLKKSIQVTINDVNEINVENNDSSEHTLLKSHISNNADSILMTNNKSNIISTSADKVSLTLKSINIKKSAKKLVLNSVLKINNKLAKLKYVYFKFNGKSYKIKTNSKGIAKLTIKKSTINKLKVGKKISYQVSYGKNSVKKTAIVKK